MAELFIERKTAIEVIHFANHTPLYIETEPKVKDAEARDVMLSLLRDADGFLAMHYLSEGQRYAKVLEHRTPIEFELEEFMKLHPKRPVLFFRRTPDYGISPSPNMLNFFDERAKQAHADIVLFQQPSDLHTKLLDAISHYRGHRDADKVRQVLIVRYLGPDFIGLVGRVSETIFTKHRLNIDYVSHASREGFATLCLSCSARNAQAQYDDATGEVVRTDLVATIENALPKQGGDGDRKGRRGNQNLTGFDLTVNVKPVQAHPPRFYVEIRTIDAPGQLNAICKVLRTLGFNIDDLQQRPTAFEYERQATSVWWLSKPDSKPRDQKKDLADLEAGLQYLVGVRSFALKVVPP